MTKALAPLERIRNREAEALEAAHQVAVSEEPEPPRVETAQGFTAAIGAVLEAVATGSITPREGQFAGGAT